MTTPLAPKAISDEAIRAFGVMIESYRSIERFVSAELVAKTPLTHTWFETLLRLASHPEHELTMGELCTRMNMTSGGATRLIDRLVEQGYVARRASPHDRRVQLATLTPEGAEVLEAAAEVHAANVRRCIVDKLSQPELDSLLETLQQIRIADKYG